MQFMVIETFLHGPEPVYARLRDKGRLMPDGLTYVSSWVSRDRKTCYQIVECGEPKLLEQWMESWRDLVDFQVVEIVSSAEAAREHDL